MTECEVEEVPTVNCSEPSTQVTSILPDQKSCNGNSSELDKEQSFCNLSQDDKNKLQIECVLRPLKEITVNRSAISEEEKEFHPEFFEGKSPKPERYLMIRNHILNVWDKTKPKYLNKTTARMGLKNCGNINHVSKVHQYLEMLGAINFDCDQACYNRPVVGRTSKTKDLPLVNNREIKQSMRKRKRRVFSDEQISLSLGGSTTEHLADGSIIVNESNYKYARKEPKKLNPFQLIECTEYTKDEAPFAVNVCIGAMVVMDFHSHLNCAEVIGLLGGLYDREKKIIEVTLAEPCLSASTQVQCEMDPVSQMEASIAIQGAGLTVVGWYHSHPTFPPNPSLRDLETQEKYQEWFGQQNDPFLAFILNPFFENKPESQLLCMLVSEERIFGSHRKPYQLLIKFFESKFDTQFCIRQAQKVVDRLSKSSAPVNPMDAYSNHPEINYFEKMIMSVKHHMSEADVDSIIISEVCHNLEEILFNVLNYTDNT